MSALGVTRASRPTETKEDGIVRAKEVTMAGAAEGGWLERGRGNRNI